MEERKEVKTIEVDFICPKCDHGKLRPTGMVLDTYPQMYQHKCTECDYTKTFYNQYPYLEYEFQLQLLVVKKNLE